MDSQGTKWPKKQWLKFRPAE